MLNTLSTPTMDLAGYIEIEAAADTPAPEVARRVNRSATLDGGAVFNDFGYADADLTIDLEWQPNDQARDENVDRLVRSYDQLIVSTRRGVFLAAPQYFRVRPGRATLRLLVAEKLTA